MGPTAMPSFHDPCKMNRHQKFTKQSYTLGSTCVSSQRLTFTSQWLMGPHVRWTNLKSSPQASYPPRITPSGPTLEWRVADPHRSTNPPLPPPTLPLPLFMEACSPSDPCHWSYDVWSYGGRRSHGSMGPPQNHCKRRLIPPSPFMLPSSSQKEYNSTLS
jgi:hypothetical protein